MRHHPAIIGRLSDMFSKPVYTHKGQCPICEKPAVFISRKEWFRDHLVCPTCRSVVRERALALVLAELRPGWRDMAIHESSPGRRGISAKLKSDCANYLATHFFPNEKTGARVGDFRNENLEAQTFSSAMFDIVVTLDVMEHVFHPERVYAEVFRTLKPGGVYIHTFPVYKKIAEPFLQRAMQEEDGTVRHLVEDPEYHGNPIDDGGSLVTYHYGYDIHRQISEWAPFDVRVYRFFDQTHGIIGEFTEVIVCTRPV